MNACKSRSSAGIGLMAVLTLLISLNAASVPPGVQAPENSEPTKMAQAEAPGPRDDARTTPSAEAPEPAPAEEAVVESIAGGIVESEPEQGTVRMKDIDLGQPVEAGTGDQHPFIRDMQIKLNLRSYYFNRQRYDNSIAEAMAVGGALSLKSGYLWERFAMGAVVYTSQPLFTPDDRGGTGILQDDQGGYTVLGQIYGEVKIIDGLQANFGRKEYNTPFINLHDVRMTPKTFQGVTFTGTHPGGKEGSNWRYGAGYIYKMKDWTDTDFDWMSDALGVDENRGVITAGGNYSTDRLSVGAINYASPDVINIFYTDGSYGWKLSSKASVKLTAQFVDQRSLGDDLIMDESFDVQQWGVKADFGVGPATFTAAFTDVSGGQDNMRSPWGGYPGFTSVQVQDFNRAGEQAIMLKAAYDFTHTGLKDFSAYVLWVHGMNRSGTDTFNEDEVDFNLQWAPKEGKMKDFSARLRYAEIMQSGGGDPSFEDFRLILNYNFTLK